VPGVGLLAMLFGLIGIMKARKTQSGMALSVIGLLLGLASVAGYAIFGGAIWAVIQGTKVNRDIAKQFITDLTAGNVTAAEAAGDGTIPTKLYQTYSDTLKSRGAISDVTTFSVNANSTNGSGQVVLVGKITHNGGQATPFVMNQLKVGSGWKIHEFAIDAQTLPSQSGGSDGSSTKPGSESTESSDEKSVDTSDSKKPDPATK